MINFILFNMIKYYNIKDNKNIKIMYYQVVKECFIFNINKIFNNQMMMYKYNKY